MRHAARRPEGWKRMVLDSLPPPGWLSADAPHSDVALSSRARIMRNLKGHRFPHSCPPEELQSVMRLVLRAARDSGLDLNVNKGITGAERDYLVGCRLISPDFGWNQPGRALLLDGNQTTSLMVNEEDHIRLQALTAGWSIDNADGIAQSALSSLSDKLEFAWSPSFGFLSASPFNCGLGWRLSSMFHLIGLAQSKRLPSVLRALSEEGIAARGLFGESSRAVGAFIQVSVTGGTRSAFVGACEYLMSEERSARAALGQELLAKKLENARHFALTSMTIGLADALRVLAWIRWAALTRPDDVGFSHREVDAMLTMLEVRTNADPHRAAQERAESLREALRL